MLGAADRPTAVGRRVWACGLGFIGTVLLAAAFLPWPGSRPERGPSGWVAPSGLLMLGFGALSVVVFAYGGPRRLAKLSRRGLQLGRDARSPGRAPVRPVTAVTLGVAPPGDGGSRPSGLHLVVACADGSRHRLGSWPIAAEDGARAVAVHVHRVTGAPLVVLGVPAVP